MGLGAIFDTIVEVAGNSVIGQLQQDASPNYANFVRGAEERNKKRALIERSQQLRESNSSSGSSAGGLASLAILGGVALFAYLSKDDNKTTTAK